jgi:hypothetical protein
MSPAVQRALDALKAGDFNPQLKGPGWRSRCPGHDDRVASLSISEGKNGSALVG